MTEAIMHSGLPVEEALISSDAITRVMARLSVSQHTALLTHWLNSEVARPDFNLSDFLIALARFQLQTHASILHHFLARGSFEHCAEMYRCLLDVEYVDHAERALRHAEGAE